MLDFNNSQRRIAIVDQEDRALLRSNPSAWSMPEDGQEHMLYHMLLLAIKRQTSLVGAPHQLRQNTSKVVHRWDICQYVQYYFH